MRRVSENSIVTITMNSDEKTLSLTYLVSLAEDADLPAVPHPQRYPRIYRYDSRPPLRLQQLFPRLHYYYPMLPGEVLLLRCIIAYSLTSDSRNSSFSRCLRLSSSCSYRGYQTKKRTIELYSGVSGAPPACKILWSSFAHITEFRVLCFPLRFPAGAFFILVTAFSGRCTLRPVFPLYLRELR